MKKILFGGVAAICTVAGMSSFKTARTNVYWYPKSLVTQGINAGTALSDANISDFSQFETSKPNSCPVPGGNYCDVEFTTAQLNFDNGTPTSLVNNFQTPKSETTQP